MTETIGCPACGAAIEFYGEPGARRVRELPPDLHLWGQA